MNTNCSGTHRYYVAEVVGVPSEGKAFVLLVCTACGDFRQHAAEVGHPGSELRLLREEKRVGVAAVSQ